MQVNRTGVEGVLHLINRTKDHAFANHAFTLKGRVVETQDHILRWHDDRGAVCRRQNVVRGHHQNTRFQLGFQRERHVNGHLVTVKVSVKGRADQRVKLDRFTFDQHGLERLNAKTVKRRRAVEHDGVFTDHLIKDVPNFGTLFFDQFLRLFHGGGQTFGLQTRVDERLKQLQGHLLGQTTLVQLQLRTGHNDRTAGEVDALTQKVLTEATLLAFQHVRERLQRALVGTGDDATTAAVVEQSVDGFLQHPLFVADDDVRRAQLNETLQTVVPVDHAAVQVVEVGGREAATIQRHQRAQFWRDHRDHGHDHPLRTVARLEEGLNHFQTLDDLLGLQLACRLFQIGAQGLGFGFQIDGGQHFADRFGTDVGGESVHAIGVLGVHVFFFGHHLTVLKIGKARLDHDVVLKVENTFQIAQGHVQHQADARGQRLEEPDVRHWRRQFDVAHTLTADLLQRDFDTTFLADNAAILHPLIFAAKTFVVFDRAKDTRAEQAVTLGLERPVVDGFRLFDLTEGPAEDPLGRGQRDLDFVKRFLRRQRVERVVCQFLVHFQILERGALGGTGPVFF